MKHLLFALAFLALGITACVTKPQDKQTNNTAEVPFLWENSNVYFLLTDRFNNGTTNNDVNFDRTKESAPLRGFMGGDFAGITQKIKDGYFTQLGIDALWFSPIAEQIHDAVDEGTGVTYGFHGYWAKDWTSIEPNFGTEEEFATLVETAHAHGIRILMDVVINHTGPVTSKDPVWDDNWVRTTPKCQYQDYPTTVHCTLVDNLPDVLTGSDEAVDLPHALKEKWAQEGRLEEEVAELDAFFAQTGYPRAPRFYIIKWLTDFVRKYGVDGYRLDTVKHTEETVWSDLWKEATKAFAEWKTANPDKVLDNNDFFMVGEVYGYGVSGDRLYNFGDVQVDYFNHGMRGLINFDFKSDATRSYEDLFAYYSNKLQGPLTGQVILNYTTSHDDGWPYDKERTKSIENANKLLLCPGASQVYYGDETGRSLIIEGTTGDATLRSFMNWDELEANVEMQGTTTQNILKHWQLLGQFRKAHPAIGAGMHTMLQESPYYFARQYSSESYNDKVVIGLDLPQGDKSVPVMGIFEEGAQLTDAYTGTTCTVKDGVAQLSTEETIVLLSL